MDNDATVYCCADCGIEGGVSLKVCKSCMTVRYCNAACQRNHWPTHKKHCKLQAAKLREDALFKDPPAKEDCPICFLPMPENLITCVSLPLATISSVPIADLVSANEELSSKPTEQYFSCCGKSICAGCVNSLPRNGGACPFCNAERKGKSVEEIFEELIKRVEAKDAGAIYALGSYYRQGLGALGKDLEKAIELWKQAAELGFTKAHFHLGIEYHNGGDLKKSKFHYEAAAMA